MNTIALSPQSDARSQLARLWRAEEAQALAPMLAAAELDAAATARITATARRLSEAVRRHASRHGLEALMRDFPLNSPSGLALLSLAESLLRVPDAANADRLIRDRLARIDAGPERTASTVRRALQLAALMVGASPSDRVDGGRGALRALMTPAVRKTMQLAMRALGGRFVFAETIEAAIVRTRGRALRGYRYSFDMLGEAALTAEDAQRYLLAYERAIQAVGESNRGLGPVNGGSVSVKLSALHPRYSYAQRGRVLQELLPRLRKLARLARQYDIALTIDAEEADRLELSLELFEALMVQEDLASWGGLGLAVQAYQKRAPAAIDYLLDLAARRPARLLLRLVKGAYWDAEIKAAQVDGMPGYPVYTRKIHTDVAYLACARRLLAAHEHVLPQFATHNAQTVATILELSAAAGAGACEFQCLFGMGEGLYRQILDTPEFYRPVRIYAPVGTRPALLAYLMRRLLENGAAASFVHRAASVAVPIEVLVADPVRQAARFGGAPQPRIPAPSDLFAPERRNSLGEDLTDDTVRQRYVSAIERGRGETLLIQPIVAAANATAATQAARPIHNPADRAELIGSVVDADEPVIGAAIDAAASDAGGWAAVEIERRARLLERAADLYERERHALVALAVREAGKTLANGIGEVREAVDFLRYYAAQIRATFERASHQPLGAVVCISPWNFPLAIFTGQIAAALAAGNTVLAKPAEQSNAIAALAVRLLHEAGIPRSALQLLPGDGERVGARLVADARINGVVFTGSTAAARAIATALGQRGDVPLIAETGGQNAMIVDSTALPEQVVSDAVRSAFDSAGQRCSALRVLCVQREIADPIITMLEGAMRELRVGDPADYATDVGPVIDEEASARIEGHVQRLRAKLRCQSALAPECIRGSFVRPTLIEIGSIAELTAEVFGPVLHVLRFDRARLPQLIADINATGYGLTLGIASRIESTISEIIEHTEVGNIYVNRNMIGAVVGVQPFGGHGLSGTGPKAGGPLYLERLLRRSPGPKLPLRRRAAAPAPLRALLEWLRAGHGPLPASTARLELVARVERYAEVPVLEAHIALEGYAGETNDWRLRARGTLRGTGRSAQTLLAQFAAAVATGNALVPDEAKIGADLRTLLAPALRRWLPPAAARYHAVLVDAGEAREHPDWWRALCRDVATADGPIVPLVVGEDGYPLERLMVEQTITRNIAAVGGDPRLLALDDESVDTAAAAVTG